MFCTGCGEKLDEQAAFCPKCGMKQLNPLPNGNFMPLFHLLPTEKRQYELTVFPDKMRISGNYLYLKDKEFYQSKGMADEALKSNFLGMGYLSQRSYRKTLWFIIGGALLEIVKVIIDKLGEMADDANQFLGWFDASIELPEGLNYALNALVMLCLILGAVLFFSKKKVIEISFTDKRICIPQNSMTQNEFNMLYQTMK